MKTSRIVIIGLSVLALIAAPVVILNMFENLDNSQIMVVQAPISGKLTWYTTAGVKVQNFGKVTKYNKRSQFWFSAKSDQGSPNDDSLRTRFNDGAHATISGSFSWDMPTNEKQLTDLHSKYGTQRAVEQQLIRTVTEKAVYMTGPLMSSAESYASRRNDLLSFVEDQMSRGVYKTEASDEKTKDAMTGQEKTVKVVKLIKGPDGNYLREEESALGDFGIKIFNLAYNEVKYDPIVEEQIQKQQQAIMEVQTAIATAKKAEQAAITAAKSGEADAAVAKWKQEVEKATQVTKAEQEKQVAETQAAQRKAVAALDLETAKLQKEANIAQGEGESKRRQLVMQADGALEKKLDAYVKVNELYAKAISEYKGAWVPSITLGGTSGNGVAGNGAQALIDLLTAKTAKELNLDLSLPQAASTPRQ